jgi:hypothetical protein
VTVSSGRMAERTPFLHVVSGKIVRLPLATYIVLDFDVQTLEGPWQGLTPKQTSMSNSG